MRGYWHFPAAAAVIAILYHLLDIKWLFILFLLWMIWLKFQRNLDTNVWIITVISLSVFTYIIPVIPHTTFEESSLEAEITGEIEGEVKLSSKQIQFTINPHHSSSKLLVTYFPEKDENVRSIPIHHKLYHGSQCTLHQSMEIPPSSTNPAQFDFRHFLLQKEITQQTVLEDFNHIHCTPENGVLPMLYKLRTKLLENIEDTWSVYSAPWVNAIVFGDSTEMEESVTELFQRFGLSHIIAISGTHVTLIIVFLYFILVKGNIITKEKAHVFLIIFLPAYAILAGANPPVLRAASMMAVLLILQKFRFKLPYTDLFSIIFMVFILWDPYIIYNVGFQFSFAVTFAILLSQQWISETKSPIWNVFQVSFVAQMAILPLQIYYFNIFHPLSILMNLVVIPYFTFFVIPLMYVFVIIYVLPGKFLELLDLGFAFVHEKVLFFIATMDDHLFPPIYLDQLPVFGVVVYFVSFFLFMKLLEQKQQKQALIIGIIFILPILITASKPYFQEEGIVTMFDMGQGDAILIEAPKREAVAMIDAGSAFQFENMEPTRGVYKNIIRAYFHQRGIKELDAIIITHDDVDHFGSVFYILEEVKVKELIVSPYFEKELLKEFQELQPSIEITQVEAGHLLNFNDAISFQVLAPDGDAGDSNDNSIVLYANLGMKWLFTGDISKPVEEKLLEHYPVLSVDILKAAHHGSKTSTSEAFIEAIRPQAALISVGRNNHYNHPNEEVLEVLESNQVRVYRTDNQGAIQFFYTEEGGTFSTFLP
ncbi:DNA internalization-related competence protein ComEC/Rec2 [Oceanobacillus sp. J11TS1]|uniref:DNA internalization-related competence protein ComEC/Rec2 n=1 Tax=Oceanobacillus sp. J11TS1 TaxID=2807191 RepID=UPI001B07FC4C|nr:DNA internalization-related competence protein ComEC/Rec2 [Oceanobacillus sp. J11TS1]GIO22066.1 DNA internalization-related competence protein ComEC/Rec2 [Oceanobacillus sp. J11TS1]